LILGTDFGHGPSSVVNHVEEIPDGDEEGLTVAPAAEHGEGREVLYTLEMSENCWEEEE
jgi:hypothetical protein